MRASHVPCSQYGCRSNATGQKIGHAVRCVALMRSAPRLNYVEFARSPVNGDLNEKRAAEWILVINRFTAPRGACARPAPRRSRWCWICKSGKGVFKNPPLGFFFQKKKIKKTTQGCLCHFTDRLDAHKLIGGIHGAQCRRRENPESPANRRCCSVSRGTSPAKLKASVNSNRRRDWCGKGQVLKTAAPERFAGTMQKGTDHDELSTSRPCRRHDQAYYRPATIFRPFRAGVAGHCAFHITDPGAIRKSGRNNRALNLRRINGAMKAFSPFRKSTRLRKNRQHISDTSVAR